MKKSKDKYSPTPMGANQFLGKKAIMHTQSMRVDAVINAIWK